MAHAPEPGPPEAPISSTPAPLIPFLVWSIAVLAYPVWFLASIVADGSRLQATLHALPTIVREGLLRLYLVVLAGALWAIATGAGMAILRRAGFGILSLAERAIFGGAIGMGIFSLGTFLLGTVSGRPQWLFATLSWTLLLAMGWVAARELRASVPRHTARSVRSWWNQASRYDVLLATLGAAIVFVALARANVPVFADYDSLEYHLGAPAQWWREGRVTFLRDMVYSNFPLNTEMLFLLTMNCLGGPGLGSVVGLQALIGFVVLGAAAVAACGKRLHSAEAGKAAAAILLTTPLLAELATLNSYVVELPQTAYSFLALYAFFLCRRAASSPERLRHVVLCGLMAGLAIGCKYPAVVFVLAPIALFILACGVARPAMLGTAVAAVAILCSVAILVASPWFIRNTVNTGNPVYPLAYNLFGGHNWTPEQDAKFTAAHRASDMRFFSLAHRVWSYGVWRDRPQGGWSPPASPILLLFALVPVALADRRSTWAVFCGGAVFLLVAGACRFTPELLTLAPDLQAASEVILSISILAIVTAPAFLIALGDAVFLGVHAVLWLMAWYVATHRLDRFLDPASPMLALLGGIGLASLGCGWARRIGRGLVAGGLVYTLVTTLLIHGPVMWVGLEESQASFLRQVCEGSTYSPAAIDAINKLPADATVLFLGESRTFYCRRRCLASSVFDRDPVERILAEGPHGNPARRVRDGLRAMGVTHIYVNWPELSRLAGSYRYHFGGTAREGVPIKEYIALIAAMTNEGYIEPLGVFGSGPQGQPRPDFVLYTLR